MNADLRPEDVVIGVENVHKRYFAAHSAFRMAGYALLSAAAALWPHGSGKRLWGGRREGLRRALSQNFQALDGISFEVARGECVGIIGLNGAGKSTLLQIVAGTLTPSAGRVLTRGRIAALLELGSGFHGEFTGRENVYLNATILGLTPQEIDRRMEAIAAFAEIGDFMDQPLKTYSSGMVVRLAFSVLTQVEPDILIVDEALSVGDIYFQHKSMRHMRELRERGVSMLFVSHTGEIIKTLCDRAILLHKGRLILDGDPSTVVDHYHGMLAEKKADESMAALSASRERSLVRSGTRQAEFRLVELLNARGQPQGAFRVGEPAVLRCVVRIHEKLSNPTFGFIIRDRFGNSVFGTNTHIHELPPVYPEAGEHLEVRFELPLNLGYGHYSVSVSAHAGATHYEGNYDWIDQILVFQILPDEKHKFVGTTALPVTLARRKVEPPQAPKRI